MRFAPASIPAGVQERRGRIDRRGRQHIRSVEILEQWIESAGTGGIELEPAEQPRKGDFGGQREILERYDLALQVNRGEPRGLDVAMSDALAAAVIAMSGGCVTHRGATHFRSSKMGPEIVRFCDNQREQHRHAKHARDDAQQRLQGANAGLEETSHQT